MGGPVRQRGAQAGRGQAEWSQVTLGGAVLVFAEVSYGVLGRGARRVKGRPECWGKALRILQVFDLG